MSESQDESLTLPGNTIEEEQNVDSGINNADDESSTPLLFDEEGGIEVN